MALLLLGHLRDLVARPAAPQHRELAVIDPHGAILAGMVDPDHRRDRVGRRIAWQIRRPFGSRGVAHAVTLREPGRQVRQPAIVQITVIASDAMRSQPAIETPNRVHCTWSQKTGWVPRICRFISSNVVAPPELTVQ